MVDLANKNEEGEEVGIIKNEPADANSSDAKNQENPNTNLVNLVHKIPAGFLYEN